MYVNNNCPISSDPTIISNKFNDYFSNVAKNTRTKIPHRSKHFSEFLKAKTINFISPTDYFIHVFTKALHHIKIIYEDSISHLLTSTQLAEESNALTVFPIRTLYQELVCHVEHYSVKLDTLHQHVMTKIL